MGPNNHWASKYISRYIQGIDMNRYAYIHDSDYERGGGHWTKLVADIRFFVGLWGAIEQYTLPMTSRRTLARKQAIVRFLAVLAGGHKCFNWNSNINKERYK
jgi:hypothetical protein